MPRPRQLQPKPTRPVTTLPVAVVVMHQSWKFRIGRLFSFAALSENFTNTLPRATCDPRSTMCARRHKLLISRDTVLQDAL